MFGHDSHHDDQPQDNNQSHNEPAADGSLDTNGSTVVTPTSDHADADNGAGAPVSGSGTYSDVPSGFTMPTPSSAPASAPAAPSNDTLTEPVGASGDLLNIKQQALQQLTPLVDHLDQTPEEKFRTTMMMIQASDDQSLVKEAYEAAQKITDEKVKAQALLDIVNEINYFTQHNS